jgi:hypothetical protein
VETVEAGFEIGFGFEVARTKIRASPAGVEKASTVVSEAAVGTGRVTSVVPGANKSSGFVCCSSEKMGSEGVVAGDDGAAMTLTSTTCVFERDGDGEGNARIYTTDTVAAFALVACEVSDWQE